MINNCVESPTGRNTETLSKQRDNEKGEKEEEEEISKTISVIPLTVNRWPGLVNSARGKESPLSRERMVSRTLFLSPPLHPSSQRRPLFIPVTIGRNRGVYTTNRYGREETMANETKGGEKIERVEQEEEEEEVEEGLAHDGTTDNCVK